MLSILYREGHGRYSCARYAQLGITGPKNFLEGVYGYFRLYAKEEISAESILKGLGEQFGLQKVMFKKYPSCGLTQGCTDAILKLAQRHEITEKNIERIEVRVPQYTYKLVGHPFQMGENPRVDAQFSIQYCTANALLRNESKLQHFDEAYINDQNIRALIKKILVVTDSDLEKRGHTALDMLVFMVDGKRYSEKVDIAPGFPGNPLTEKDHEKHFWDCIKYSNPSFSTAKADQILASIKHLERLNDVLILIPFLLI